MLALAALLAACSGPPPAPESASPAPPSLPAATFAWRQPPVVRDVLVAQPLPGQSTGVTTERIAINSISLTGDLLRLGTVPAGQLPGHPPERFFGPVAMSLSDFVSVVYEHDGRTSVRIYDIRRPATPIAVIDASPGTWGPNDRYAAERVSPAEGESSGSEMILFDPSTRQTRTMRLPVGVSFQGDPVWTRDGAALRAFRLDGRERVVEPVLISSATGQVVASLTVEDSAWLDGQPLGADGSRLVLDAPRTAGGPPPRLLTVPPGSPQRDGTVWYDGSSDAWIPRWYGWDTDGAGVLFLAERSGQLTFERHDTPEGREVLGPVPLRNAAEVTVEAVGRDRDAGEIVAVLRYRFEAATSTRQQLFLYRTVDHSLLPLADSGQLVDAQVTFLGFRPVD